MRQWDIVRTITIVIQGEVDVVAMDRKVVVRRFHVSYMSNLGDQYMSKR